jgi:serine/threonine-protein kinase
VQIGQIVSGKYRIERQIGRGGMGIVLAATHLQLGHLVAIKVMRRDLVVDDKVLDRLLMEARAAAKIRSEHVARVLDVGTLENGSPFIVMEYLDGENLADLLDRQGALEIQQAVTFMLQCCLALAEVHAAEMVHRDLKPGNLFIARLPDGAPSVKIVDFGISKYIGGSARDGATTSAQVLGSPFYMSPEQMRAEAVDERSDIWGLGAILFEMLTGRPPFIGDTLPEVYSAVLNQAPPPVDTWRPGVPAGLDDIVHRCLEKNPAQRFCDVADLAEALSPYAGTAAWLVERVTRTLTNPDAARPRHSLAAIEAPSFAGAAGVEQSQYAREGMMDEDSEHGGAARPGERGFVDGNFVDRNGEAELAQPGRTVLEGGVHGADADLQLEEPWRPSRPGATSLSTSGEVAPFSATGIQTGRLGVLGALSRWRFVGIGAGLALVLVIVGVWWARPAPPAAGEPPANAVAAVRPPEVEVAPVARAPEPQEPIAQPEPAAAEPRVTPIVAPPAPAAAPSRAVQTRAHALQPAVPTRAAPVKTTAEVRTNAGETDSSGAALADSPDWDEPSAPEVVPPRAASARGPSGTDPWNPESFGDRR